MFWLDFKGENNKKIKKSKKFKEFDSFDYYSSLHWIFVIFALFDLWLTARAYRTFALVNVQGCTGEQTLKGGHTVGQRCPSN